MLLIEVFFERRDFQTTLRESEMYSEGRNHDQVRFYRPDLRRSTYVFKRLGTIEKKYFSVPERKLWAIFDGDENFHDLWHRFQKRFNF